MMIRCSVYARYSSDLQREASIEDQIRRCRAYAKRMGWTVLDEYVRWDEAKSVATLAGRSALQSLIRDAKSKPRPFDRMLIDDTSRLARNLPDCLRQIDTLRLLRCSRNVSEPKHRLGTQFSASVADVERHDG